MKGRISARIVFGIVLAISIIEGFWVPAIILALIFTWIFDFYAEALLAGIMFDVLYMPHGDTGMYAYVGALLGLLILIVLAFAKSVVRR